MKDLNPVCTALSSQSTSSNVPAFNLQCIDLHFKKLLNKVPYPKDLKLTSKLLFKLT